VKIERDDVTHDTSLTLMMLLLPCISFKRASNIVPFNTRSLMFLIPLLFSEGSSDSEDVFMIVFIFFVASFLRKKA
jgi:hypothetical protein